MKSILKKALIMLIAVAVLAVPMAASAAAPDYDENNQVALSVGEKSYTVSSSYNYTVFSFQPDEKAEYTFTAGGKKLGIVSYNGMWVTVEPSATTITESTVTWKCTGVGQSIWIAVKTDKASNVSVKVDKKTVADQEIPYTDYKNEHTPVKFTFDGKESELQYIDVEDGIDDSMLLFKEENGDFYHYKSANGPIVYVNLDDPMMNLIDAIGYGKLAYIGYDGDKVVTKINFTDAFTEYVEKADSTTKLYPLTADLIQIYRLVGQNQNWYGADGFLELTDVDSWMFACYYDATKLEEDNNNDNNDNNNDNNNAGGNTDGGSNNDNNNDNNSGNNTENNGNVNNNTENSNNSNNSGNTNGTTDNSTENNSSADNNQTSTVIPNTGDNSAVNTAILLIILSSVAMLAVKKLKNY